MKIGGTSLEKHQQANGDQLLMCDVKRPLDCFPEELLREKIKFEARGRFLVYQLIPDVAQLIR